MCGHVLVHGCADAGAQIDAGHDKGIVCSTLSSEESILFLNLR
jgi:hypothetical protein